MKRISLAVLALLMTAQQCFAGGVALSTTRVIYDGGKKEASLTVENHNKNEEFLIQSWIDDVNGNKKTPFIITPPLFKLDPDKNNVLRIVNIEDTLPKDRESVYWINVLIKITSYVLLILKIPYPKIVNPFTGLM